MEYDNPAARLLSLLEDCKRVPGNTNCRKAWAHILSTGDDLALLMSRLGRVMDLPRVTIAALRESYPKRENTWTHWNAKVTHAFTHQNFHANWETFVSHIDSHTMNYLQMSADLLQSRATTKMLEPKQLDEIRAQIQEAYNDVLEAPVDDEIKKYLARSLRRILTMLDEYRITGALPLLESVETMLGHAQVDSTYKNFMLNTDLGRKILDSLGAMASVVTVAVGIPQLSTIVPLLVNG